MAKDLGIALWDLTDILSGCPDETGGNIWSQLARHFIDGTVDPRCAQVPTPGEGEAGGKRKGNFVVVKATIIMLLLACTQAGAGPRAHLDYVAEVKNPEKRLPILAEARQLLREAGASETNRAETLALCLKRCEQLLWVRPDDVFAEALVILAEATWLKGHPGRALKVLKAYDKIIRTSGRSRAEKGVPFADRTDYQAEMLRGRIHEQKGMAAFQAKDHNTARSALTESWRCFASAAALAGHGFDSPAAHKAAEVKRLIP